MQKKGLIIIIVVLIMIIIGGLWFIGEHYFEKDLLLKETSLDRPYNIMSQAECLSKGGFYLDDDWVTDNNVQCFFPKEPKTINQICEDWNKKMIENKNKILDSVKYLDEVIGDEDRLILGLWNAFFQKQDPINYNNIFQNWIERRDKVVEGVPYVFFRISYSVKMSDFYFHDVGIFNYVIIEKAKLSELLDVLSVHNDQAYLVDLVERNVPYTDFDKVIWDVVQRSHILGKLKDLNGWVAVQRYPFLLNDLTCEQMVSKLRLCDEELDFTGVHYGTDFDKYGLVQMRQGFSKHDYEVTYNAWAHGDTNFLTGKLENCYRAKLSFETGEVSCYEKSCDEDVRAMQPFGS